MKNEQKSLNTIKMLLSILDFGDLMQKIYHFSQTVTSSFISATKLINITVKRRTETAGEWLMKHPNLVLVGKGNKTPKTRPLNDSDQFECHSFQLMILKFVYAYMCMMKIC